MYTLQHIYCDQYSIILHVVSDYLSDKSEQFMVASSYQIQQQFQ